MASSNLGGRGLFDSHTLNHTSLKEAKAETQTKQEPRGRNPESGADAGAMEEGCLLACSPWIVQSTFLIEPRNHQPRGGPTHNGLGPPFLITN